jgi:hypothetical protein
MNQALYAHMNKYIKFTLKKKLPYHQKRRKKVKLRHTAVKSFIQR